MWIVVVVVVVWVLEYWDPLLSVVVTLYSTGSLGVVPRLLYTDRHIHKGSVGSVFSMFSVCR